MHISKKNCNFAAQTAKHTNINIMPKIYEYLGYVFYFYSNEHEPIHVHATANGRESIFEIIMDNGVLVEIRVRNSENKAPLKAKEAATAEAFVRKYYKNIIAKWVNFFVMRKAIKSTQIRTKL